MIKFRPSISRHWGSKWETNFVTLQDKCSVRWIKDRKRSFIRKQNSTLISIFKTKRSYKNIWITILQILQWLEVGMPILTHQMTLNTKQTHRNTSMRLKALSENTKTWNKISRDSSRKFLMIQSKSRFLLTLWSTIKKFTLYTIIWQLIILTPKLKRMMKSKKCLEPTYLTWSCLLLKN